MNINSTKLPFPPKPSFAQLMGTSPYFPGVLPVMVMLLAGAVLAGAHGLGPKLEPLLLDPKFSALALAMLGLHVLCLLAQSTLATARAGENLGPEWFNIWIPVKLALTAGLFLPVSDGVSPLMHSIVWAVRWGAGF